MTTSKAAGNVAKLNDIIDVTDPLYGASPSASGAVNAAAIQAALDTGKSIFIGPGTFEFTAKLKFRATGQMIIGAGNGDNGGTGITRLKYTGAANGKMLSWFDGTSHYSNCSVQNIAFNGNALANKCLELYDDTSPGGCWRAFVLNCSIIGVTNGVTPTNVYGGAGTGVDNANDFNLHHVDMFGGARGVVSGGAIGSLTGRCTIQGQTTAGVSLSSGAAIHLGDTTFSANAWDIIATNTQLVSATGAWFENSTSGIYQAATAHNLALTGCFLHTSNATRLMDFGSAAGYHSLNGNYLSSITASAVIANVNQGATGIISGQGLTARYVTTALPVPSLVSSAAYTALSSLLVNSWVDYGAGLEVSGFWIDAEGVVHLRGGIKNGTTADGTTLFTLPAGNRPAAAEVFPVVSNKLPCAISINSAGVVAIEGAGASTTYLSLSGVTFKAA